MVLILEKLCEEGNHVLLLTAQHCFRKKGIQITDWDWTLKCAHSLMTSQNDRNILTTFGDVNVGICILLYFLAMHPWIIFGFFFHERNIVRKQSIIEH